MKLRLAVCDDEPAAVRSVSAQLKRELAELGDEAELCLFTQSPDLARQLRRGERFDALFAEYSQNFLDAGYQEIMDERLEAYKAGNTTKLPELP